MRVHRARRDADRARRVHHRDRDCRRRAVGHARLSQRHGQHVDPAGAGAVHRQCLSQRDHGKSFVDPDGVEGDARAIRRRHRLQRARHSGGRRRVRQRRRQFPRARRRGGGRAQRRAGGRRAAHRRHRRLRQRLAGGRHRLSARTTHERARFHARRAGRCDRDQRPSSWSSSAMFIGRPLDAYRGPLAARRRWSPMPPLPGRAWKRDLRARAAEQPARAAQWQLSWCWRCCRCRGRGALQDAAAATSVHDRPGVSRYDAAVDSADHYLFGTTCHPARILTLSRADDARGARSIRIRPRSGAGEHGDSWIPRRLFRRFAEASIFLCRVRSPICATKGRERCAGIRATLAAAQTARDTAAELTGAAAVELVAQGLTTCNFAVSPVQRAQSQTAAVRLTTTRNGDSVTLLHSSRAEYVP